MLWYIFARMWPVPVGENDDVVMAPPEKELIATTYLMAPGKRYHLLNDISGVVVLDLLCFQNVVL
ncbi:MAG: hypothetical protein GQ542_00825 [Desulforhopalus sp.]|nr:hypothetical protein [Desulforhopalus sp.]